MRLLTAAFFMAAVLFFGCDTTTGPIQLNPENTSGGNSHPGKGVSNETQINLPEYSTTLKTLVGGDYIEVGGVSVYRFDDGFHFNVTEYTECYEILEIKAWVGNELTDLASIQANPDMFPDRYVETIYDGSYNIVVPYDESWTCENSIYTAVFAKVRNTCNSGSGEETTVAIAGEEILWAGKKINAGKVIYKVENG